MFAENKCLLLFAAGLCLATLMIGRMCRLPVSKSKYLRKNIHSHRNKYRAMSSTDTRIKDAKDLLELCYDFPKPGVVFKNLFPVLRNPSVFKGLIDVLVDDIRDKYDKVDIIVGLDSRGFLLGPMIAQALNVAFVPVRKKGKLPGETFGVEYSLEYGKDTIEIQKNSIQPRQRVVIVDDLLATGGTMKAACDLMDAAEAEVLVCIVVIEIKELKGRHVLKYPFLSYIS